MENMRAYIDSFDKITLLLGKETNLEDKKFFLYDGKNSYNLVVISCYEEEWNYKFILENKPFVELNKEYYIVDEKKNQCLLRSGSVIRTTDFEKKYAYDGPLGFEYTKEKTTFRVWTPVAKEIYITLICKGKKERLDLTYVDKGLWEGSINKDIEGYGYYLSVRVFENFVDIKDPYAISSAANGKMNYVVDVKKLYKMQNSKPKFSGIYTDAVIYEASVRDFTYHLKGDKQGTFLGMIENASSKINEATGLDYIASLGITHLQLLPIFDFGGVDDLEKNMKYNWGYNPKQYFVPSGWYSTNPDDPYARIIELQKLIDEAHKRGLRIIMDVVFNHVYKYEEFSFDYLVPGYFYRVEADGKMSNASCCGNDLATERYMCSRYVRDVLKHFVKLYHVSGYRFDLMGLLDIDTLEKAQRELKKLEPNIILYGEGWNMANPLPDEKRPHMFNHKKIPEYAFFNDRFRNFLRGNQWNHTPGYAFNVCDSNFDLFHLVTGSCLDFYKFKEPTQTINYVECHDNYTFYDFGVTYLRYQPERVMAAAKLALQVVIVSEGIPFIHAGEEFFRTKQGVENSYKDKDDINRFDYGRRNYFKNNVFAIRDLIEIRKEYPELRLSTRTAISENIHLLEEISDFHILAYLVEGNNYNLIVVIKNDDKLQTIVLNEAYMIYNANGKCNIAKEEYAVENPGVYIFKEVK